MKKKYPYARGDMTAEKRKHTRPLKPESPEPASDESSQVQARAEASAEEETKMVTLPLKDYAGQLEELDTLRDKVEEYKDGWQHERADYSNYRKLVERTAQDQKQDATIQVIKKYLVILDDLQRALKTRPMEGEAASWSEGVDLIVRKLQGILDSEGIMRIPAENEIFNPLRHEAISHEESTDHESGQIIEVVQQGYTIGDRVIRPALVRVAR
jgi:molecular chaperone GrpE